MVAGSLTWHTAQLRKKPLQVLLFLVVGLVACMTMAAAVWYLQLTDAPSTDGVPESEPVLTARAWPQNLTDIEDIIQVAYHRVDGTTISAGDAASSNSEGTFMKTYGEFTPDGVQVLLNELAVGPGDVFCDLGSGVGKVVVQALLARKPSEAMGIELSQERHDGAEIAHHRLTKLLPSMAEGPRLRFVHGDILALDEEVARCNKIFFCSTVWPPELLKSMQEKLTSMSFRQTPVLVASSRELKDFGGLSSSAKYKGVEFRNHARVDTSWGASFISMYELKGQI